jgi:hypothetical protein
MLTSLQYKCVNKQTRWVRVRRFSKSEIFGLGLGLGRPKSSDYYYYTLQGLGFLVKQQQRYGSYSTLLMYRGVNSIPTGNNLITIISTRYLLISLITWNYLIDMFLINLSGRAWPTGSIQYSSQSSQVTFLPFDSPIVHLVGNQDCWWPIKLHAMYDLDPGLTMPASKQPAYYNDNIFLKHRKKR